jgi:ribosomal protein L7/L12
MSDEQFLAIAANIFKSLNNDQLKQLRTILDNEYNSRPEISLLPNEEEKEMLRRHNHVYHKIELIKKVRARLHNGLAEAKQLVEQWMANPELWKQPEDTLRLRNGD